MVKTKAKRLLSLFLAFAMVLSLTVTPVYAADDDDASSGSGTSEAGETSSTSAATFSEPEAAEAEAVEAVEDEAEAEGEELVVADEEEEPSYGIAAISEDGTVATVGEANYSSLEAAIAAANSSNGTVTLQESVALDTSIVISGTVTLDLNGNSITRADGNTTSYLVGVQSGASLTVKDDIGNGYIEGGTYTKDVENTDGSTSTKNYAGYAVLTNGSVTLESGTLKSESGYGVYVSGSSASLTVTGGTVSGNYGVYVYSGNVTVGGGTVSGTSRGISISSTATSSTVTVSDGAISGNYGIYGAAGTLNVSGGTVSGTQIGIMANYSLNANVSGSAVITGTHGIYGYQGTYTGTVKISGGTVGNSSTSYGLNLQSGSAEISGGTVTGTSVALIQLSGSVSITDGTIGGDSCTRGMNINPTYSNTTTTITGGTVSATNLGIYVQDYTSGDTSYTATLTIGTSGDTSTTSPSISGTDYGGIYATTGADVIVNSGSVTGDSAILVWGGESATNKTTLTVNGGSISGTTFGVVTNGSTYYTSITVNSGTIYGGGTGMYLPAMDSTTTINGGTITGEATGIEIRAGSLNVNGGTITGKGNPGSSTENGNGTTTVGAAIAVVQHTTKQAITVSVSGDAELDGYYGIFEGDLQGNGEEYTKNVSIEVSGGTVNGTEEAIYQATGESGIESAAAIAVTGGTYSTDVSEYCGASYTTTTSDGGTTYTVSSSDTKVASVTSGETTTEYANLKAALAAASDGDTVTLLGDLTIDSQLTIDKDITLDLGGYTLTNDFVNVSGTGANRFSLITTADVTIQNGTYAATAPETTDGVETRGICESSGNLTLSGLTVTCNGINVCNYADHGELTITDCNISGTYAVGSFANNSTVTISDSALTGSVCGLYHNGSYCGLTLTVTDTTIIGGNADSSVTGANDATAVYISGSTYTTEAAGKNQSATFTNCTITGATGIEVKYTDLTLTNCTVTATGATPTYEQYNNGSTTTGFAVVSTDNSMTPESPEPTGTIKIDGGTYTGAVGLDSIVDKTTYTGFKEADYEIYSGTFSTDVSEYCVEGLTAAATGDVYIIVNEENVAAVYDANGDYVDSYTTLTKAINAAGEDAVVYMLKDVDNEAIGIASTKSITLDLNGYTLSAGDLVTGNLITMRGGDLTIQDSGEDGTITSGAGSAVIYNAGGTVTVNGGTISATGSIPAISNNWQSSNYAEAPSKVVVNGGKVTAAGAAALRNNVSGCSITVNGGEIVGFSGSTGYYIVDSASDENSGAVVITGGYFTTNTDSASQVLFYQKNSGVFAVSGGYFNNEIGWINSSMRAAGYSNTTTSEVYNKITYGYTVSSAAILYGYIPSGSTTVTYLGGAANSQQAVNGLNNADIPAGATLYIELQADAEAAFDIGTGSDTTVILELNGYNITTDTAAAIIVESGVTLTVQDSVGTSTVTSACTTGTVRNRGGVLTIASGVYKNTLEAGYVIQNNGSEDADGSKYSTTLAGGSYSGTYSVTKGTLTITGGYFTDDPSDYTGNCEVAKSSDENADYPYYVADVIVGRNIDLKSGVITMNVYIKGEYSSMTMSPASSNALNVTEYEGDAVDANYVLSQNVVAKKMADDWTVTVTLSNGYAVDYTTSVQSYAETLLKTTDSETVKNVLEAMLDYGAAVQEYAEYNTTALANGGTYYSDLSNITASYMSLTKNTTTTGDSAPTLKSMGMTLNHDFSIVLTYRSDLAGYTATVTDVQNNSLASSQVTLSGTTLTISGLSAADLNQIFTIKVTDGTNTNTTELSGLYYAQMVAGSGTTASELTAKNKLGRTLYLYSTSLSSLADSESSYVEE